jgi:hemoglobin
VLLLPIVDAAPAPPGASEPAAEARPDLRVDDLPALLTAFYAALARDPSLAGYFAPIDMAAHVPRIADFWATVLFRAGRYDGNAFAPHRAMPGLTPAHFARWLAALERTVEARHAGPNAERMLAMAHRIAYSMQLRLGLQPCAPCAPYAHTGARAAP